MPSALLSSAQKDIIGSQARDYTALVRQVKDILPQFSDDQVCDALVQSNEDISRAVELLMSQQPTSKQSKKKEKHKNREARAQAEAETAEAAFEASGHVEKQYADEAANEPREERPKTAAEKEAAKLRKKLREIERIEDKVARGEKVDPLQLPKLDKKRETEVELRAAEHKILQEEEERRQQEEQLRKQEEWERHREAQEAERRRQENAYQHQAAARILPEPVRQYPSWLVSGESEIAQPASEATPDTHQHMRNELLNMLHKAPQESKGMGFTQSEQTASHLGGGSYTRGPQQTNGENYRHSYRSEQQAYQRPYSQYNSYEHYGQQYGSQHYGSQQYGHQQSRYHDWKQEDWRQRGSWNKEAPQEKPRPELPEDEAPKADWANLYSTQLDISSIPADKRAEAERIAKEIEQNSGGGDGWDRPDAGPGRANGKGQGDYGSKNGKSHGKGKSKKGKGSKGKAPYWSKDGPGRSEWQPKHEEWQPKHEDWQPKAEEWPKGADWVPQLQLASVYPFLAWTIERISARCKMSRCVDGLTADALRQTLTWRLEAAAITNQDVVERCQRFLAADRHILVRLWKGSRGKELDLHQVLEELCVQRLRCPVEDLRGPGRPSTERNGMPSSKPAADLEGGRPKSTPRTAYEDLLSAHQAVAGSWEASEATCHSTSCKADLEDVTSSKVGETGWEVPETPPDPLNPSCPVRKDSYKDLQAVNVVVVVFSGRRDRMRILMRYLRRDLRKHGGVVDKIVFALWQYTAKDLSYMKELVSSPDGADGTFDIQDFSEQRWGRSRIDADPISNRMVQLYKSMNETDTVYVKVDDDVVYVAEHAIAELVRERLRKRCLLVSANVVNHAIMSALHQDRGAHRGFWPTEEQQRNPVLRLPWSKKEEINTSPDFQIERFPASRCVVERWDCAALVHESFLDRSADNTLCVFDFGWHDFNRLGYREHRYIHRSPSVNKEYWTQGARWSTNFFAFRAEDLDGVNWSNVHGKGDDEEEFTGPHSERRDRHSCAVGAALVVHFSYGSQEEGLMAYTNLLKRYDKLSRRIWKASKPDAPDASRFKVEKSEAILGPGQLLIHAFYCLARLARAFARLTKALREMCRTALVQSVVRVRAFDAFRPWSRSHGSGFLWDHNGHIVTNFHVVQHASFVSVHFADGLQCRAKVKARCEPCDLAVLQVLLDSCSGSDLQLPPPLRLARHGPDLGAKVAAVGHPEHWAWLLGVGHVTGIGRRSSRAVQRFRVDEESDGKHVRGYCRGYCLSQVQLYSLVSQFLKVHVLVQILAMAAPFVGLVTAADAAVLAAVPWASVESKKIAKNCLETWLTECGNEPSNPKQKARTGGVATASLHELLPQALAAIRAQLPAFNPSSGRSTSLSVSLSVAIVRGLHWLMQQSDYLVLKDRRMDQHSSTRLGLALPLILQVLDQTSDQVVRLIAWDALHLMLDRALAIEVQNFRPPLQHVLETCSPLFLDEEVACLAVAPFCASSVLFLLKAFSRDCKLDRSKSLDSLLRYGSLHCKPNSRAFALFLEFGLLPLLAREAWLVAPQLREIAELLLQSCEGGNALEVLLAWHALLLLFGGELQARVKRYFQDILLRMAFTYLTFFASDPPEGLQQEPATGFGKFLSPVTAAMTAAEWTEVSCRKDELDVVLRDVARVLAEADEPGGALLTRSLTELTASTSLPVPSGGAEGLAHRLKDFVLFVKDAVGLGEQEMRERGAEALQDFQERCSVDGIVFASVAAGHGSSGGPLLDSHGDVTGVITWQFSGSQPVVIAAISTSVVRQVVPQLISQGSCSLPHAGAHGPDGDRSGEGDAFRGPVVDPGLGRYFV
ncbi:DEGP1 [Symbiodinium sp. KB8]|nr:DEGP1 [Symbiodinium sp. KB8]